MKVKPSQIITYLIYALISAAVYGLLAFFVIFRGLAGENMLHAYIWNVVFIFGFLLLDKLANSYLLSKEITINKKNYFIAGLAHSLSFISFKTTLYLFYAFVLIISRVSLLEPYLFDPLFRSFVLSIEYCLIFLVALDKFMEHLSKDDRRIKIITAKFDKFFGLAAKRRGKRP
ncbi:MAG: hypothetical protein FWE21_01740 [Defluviitaleaceae bacterium]|nr:hypothetical protein [Defluviitaleaceae bacterium]